MDINFIIKKILYFDLSDPISFINIYFLFAFAFLVLIYSIVYKKTCIRKWLLIIFNLFFYYKLTGILCLVIFIPAFTDFFIARLISKLRSDVIKKLYLFTSVFISLGLLIYFKYTDFFIQIYNSVSGNTFSLLNILVPVGISYFIFRTISYVIDVYYEKIEPVKNIGDYVLYMTFFPLLISGPITRAQLFLPQINSISNINKENINQGLYFILKGIIKKAIIADYLGLYVNIVFSVPGGYTGFENLMAILGFAMQLYYDFSGYTDIAIGISMILGFDIGINFNRPYTATSITEFWRRWHISLYDWLRDYIYTPLTYFLRKWKMTGSIISMIITFVICGIWHGAAMKFILWGLLYGIALSWEIGTKNIFGKIKKHVNIYLYKFIGWLFTFSFVASLLVLLRAIDIDSATKIYFKLFTNMDLSYFMPFMEIRYLFVIVFLISFIMLFISPKAKQAACNLFIRLPLIIKIFVFFVIIQTVLQWQDQNMLAFIYAQF
jgi:alginate O-acetyltransferase complex protein AlgI